MQERQKSAANGSLDFNYDFNQPMGQRNFDEPDFGTRMMGSIDLSAHNFDIIGSSSSSDESLSQSNVCSLKSKAINFYDNIYVRK